MKCQFAGDWDGSFFCQRCGRSGIRPKSHSDPSRIHAVCRKPGIGDWLAYWLFALFGIDKGRVIVVKRWLGLAPRCGCQQRQEALNTLGDRLGRRWRALRARFLSLLGRGPGEGHNSLSLEGRGQGEGLDPDRELAPTAAAQSSAVE